MDISSHLEQRTAALVNRGLTLSVRTVLRLVSPDDGEPPDVVSRWPAGLATELGGLHSCDNPLAHCSESRAPPAVMVDNNAEDLQHANTLAPATVRRVTLESDGGLHPESDTNC